MRSVRQAINLVYFRALCNTWDIEPTTISDNTDFIQLFKVIKAKSVLQKIRHRIRYVEMALQLAVDIPAVTFSLLKFKAAETKNLAPKIALYFVSTVSALIGLVISPLSLVAFILRTIIAPKSSWKNLNNTKKNFGMLSYLYKSIEKKIAPHLNNEIAPHLNNEIAPPLNNGKNSFESRYLNTSVDLRNFSKSEDSNCSFNTDSSFNPSSATEICRSILSTVLEENSVNKPVVDLNGRSKNHSDARSISGQNNHYFLPYSDDVSHSSSTDRNPSTDRNSSTDHESTIFEAIYGDEDDVTQTIPPNGVYQYFLASVNAIGTSLFSSLLPVNLSHLQGSVRHETSDTK